MVEMSQSGMRTRRERVLIVEDETGTRQLIAGFLKRLGYECIEAWTVSSARRLIETQAFAFVILDLELEDDEGYQLMRHSHAEKPIYIVVSSRTDVVDRLLSFELGADDYLIKPIDLRELHLRLQRSGTRSVRDAGYNGELLTRELGGKLKLNMRDRAITSDNRVHCLLNRREFKTLCLFLERPNNPISRDEISREVSGRRHMKESRAVDVLISNIRAKLSASGSHAKIKNVRGEGYIFQSGDNGSDGAANAE